MTDTGQPIRSYSAETASHGFLSNVPHVVGYPALIWRHRYFLQNFFRRELLGRFRGSALGVLWVLIQPIFQFTVYYLVFGYLFGHVRTGTAPSADFALYLFTGMIAFNALNEGCMRSCFCILENSNLVKKVAFPSELLPLPSIFVSLVVYAVGALVAVAIGFGKGVLHPDWTLLLLPVVLAVQLVFSAGIGLLLANLNVFARDVGQLWGIIGMAWMFLTPIFWFPHQVEANLGPFLQTILRWNPAYPIVQSHRIVLGMRDRDIDGVAIRFGDLGHHLLVASVWAAVMICVGYGLFRSRKHHFADLV
ncbi:MAG: ABC transporter permease [Planctomycetota bacterium]